jgi:hypothetical protein
MSQDQRKRQTASDRQKAKEAARRKKMAALFSRAPSETARPADTIRSARAFPIHDCFINPSWRTEGLAKILLSRQQPDGRITFGVYLVDLYCLGVKNTFCNAGFALRRYEEDTKPGVFGSEPYAPCPVPLAHEIIYGGIDYAASLGFGPHHDFELSEHILEPREALRQKTGVEFGHDGMPLYVTGPRDDVDQILETLRKNLGEGNFHFIVGGPI